MINFVFSILQTQSFNLRFALGIWSIFIFASALIIFILAINRHKNKKNILSKNLLNTFAFYWLSTLFLSIYIWYRVFPIDLGDSRLGNPGWFYSLLKHLLYHAQFAYFCFIIGTYFLYKFSNIIFEKESISKKKEKNAMIFAVILIAFGVFRLLFPLNNPTEIANILYGLEVWVIFYIFLTLFPIIFQGKRLLSLMDRNIDYYRNIKYIVYTALIIILMMIFYILETFYNILYGEETNIFSFLGNGFAFVGLLTAYIGFYSNPKRRK